MAWYVENGIFFYMTHPSHTTATWLGVASIAQWSLLPLLAKLAGDVPPFQLTGLAFAVASFLVLCLWRVQRTPILEQFRLPLPLLALGCWGLFGFHFCYFFAFQKAPAVEAFLLVELWPILIVLLAAPLAKEKLLTHHMIAALLGFAGVIAIAGGKGEFHGFSSDYALGYGLAIMAAITWAGYSVLSRRFASQMSDNAIGVFCILSALLSFISHGLFESWVSLTPLQWLAVVLMGIGPVGSAFFTWNTGMKHGNIALLGVLSLAIPLLGTLGLILGGYGSFTPAITLATGFILSAGLVGSGVWKRKKL